MPLVHHAVKTDPVEFPRHERASIVVPDANLVRSSNIDGLNLELVFVSRLEVVSAVIELDLVRLDRLSLLILTVDDQLDVGVSTGALLVSSGHQTQPRHHCAAHQPQ